MYDSPVNQENSNIARVTYVRNIRKVAGMVAVLGLTGAAYIVYALGLQAHPHKVELAIIIACVYLVVLGGSYSFVYRSQMAAAKRM
jgi:hypothetical protein